MIIGVVSCFILCNEERELMQVQCKQSELFICHLKKKMFGNAQEVALDTPLKEAYADIFRSIEASADPDAAAAEGGGGGVEKMLMR